MSEGSSFKPGDHITASIEKMTYGGAGFSTVSGEPVLIYGSFPGQEVEGTIIKGRGKVTEAKATKVIKRSIDQITPRCSHLHDAGGSQWQGLPYDKQIQYKEDIVREALEHLTPASDDVKKLLPGRVLKIMPSPQVFHYRNALDLHFGMSEGGVPSIGFFQPDQPHILPVTECHLYDEQLAMLIADMQRFMQETRLPVYDKQSGKGLLRSLLLRRGLHTGEQMLVFLVKGRKKELEPLFQHFMRFGGRSGVKSLQVIEHMGIGINPEHAKPHVLTGESTISERVFDLNVAVGPFSHLHPNTFALEKLAQAIADSLELTVRDTVLSLNCGMGATSQYLARFCERLIGVEQGARAIDEALQSSGANRIGNIGFYKGRPEHVLTSQLAPGGKYTFTKAVVDAPRGGMHPKSRKALIAHGLSRIVIASCNPSTFARDLPDFLAAGYDLRSVQPVDMFPHTAHFSVVGVLEKRG